MKHTALLIGFLVYTMVAKAGIFSMVEINPLHGDCHDLFVDSSKNTYGAGNLKHFAKLNGLLYFVGADQAQNDELWVTDGTQAGTHLVKEINSNTGAGIGDLRVIGNKLIFFADESSTGTVPSFDFDLYVSDGTATGTYKILDCNQQYNTFLADQSAGITNGKLIFCTNTDVMVTDGTAAGTQSLATINIQSYIGSNGYCELNGFVYFIINSDIWKSDGTIGGTKSVKSVLSSTNPWPLMYSNYIKVFDGKLYIIGAKSGEGDDLFTFDGTESGAVTKVLSTPNGNSYPGSLSICGGALWFTASDSISTSIYKLASASSPVQKIANANGYLSFCGSKVYSPNMDNNGFNVIDAITNVQTSFSKSSINLGGVGFVGSVNSMLSIGNKVSFLGYDTATSQQVLCISDGTSAGTRVEMPTGVTQIHPFDYVPGCAIIDVFDLISYDDKLVIPANFNSAGRELWFYAESGMNTSINDPTTVADVKLYPNPSNSSVTIDISPQKHIESMIVQIIDMSGRIVSDHVIDGTKTSMSTSELADGGYIVCLKKGSETIARRKLSVAH